MCSCFPTAIYLFACLFVCGYDIFGFLCFPDCLSFFIFLPQLSGVVVRVDNDIMHSFFPLRVCLFRVFGQCCESAAQVQRANVRRRKLNIIRQPLLLVVSPIHTILSEHTVSNSSQPHPSATPVCQP